MYYLTYSANFYASISYSVGYAVSDSPLGTFTKAEENPILTSGFRHDVSGPGHHSFTTSPDGTQLWIAYHSHSNPQSPSGDRKVNIDRAVFTEDGKLFMCGPTTTTQPLPSGGVTSDITSAFSGSIILSNNTELPDGQKLSAIAVWPDMKALSDVQSISLILDSESHSEEKEITGDSASPILLTFDPREAAQLQIVLTVKENVTELNLSEIGVYLK